MGWWSETAELTLCQLLFVFKTFSFLLGFSSLVMTCFDVLLLRLIFPGSVQLVGPGGL